MVWEEKSWGTTVRDCRSTGEVRSLLCPRMRMVERGRNDAVRRCGTLLVLSAVVLVEVGFDRYWAV